MCHMQGSSLYVFARLALHQHCSAWCAGLLQPVPYHTRAAVMASCTFCCWTAGRIPGQVRGMLIKIEMLCPCTGCQRLHHQALRALQPRRQEDPGKGSHAEWPAADIRQGRAPGERCAAVDLAATAAPAAGACALSSTPTCPKCGAPIWQPRTSFMSGHLQTARDERRFGAASGWCLKPSSLNADHRRHAGGPGGEGCGGGVHRGAGKARAAGHRRGGVAGRRRQLAPGRPHLAAGPAAPRLGGDHQAGAGAGRGGGASRSFNGFLGCLHATYAAASCRAAGAAFVAPALVGLAGRPPEHTASRLWQMWCSVRRCCG